MRWQNTEFVGRLHPNWKYGETTESYRNVLRREGVMQKCVLCDCEDKRILVVHHIDKNRKNNQPHNLTWMCPNCHFLVHHYEKENKKLLEICQK